MVGGGAQTNKAQIWSKHVYSTRSSSIYNPSATFEISVTDVEYLTVDRYTFLARLYEPRGAGPFPALLDIHGGAWSGSERLTNETVDRALASTGLVVMSIDFRLAPAHPYPAQVADANYGVRWLKAHAFDFNVDNASLGVIGRSSGGHTALLHALRPRDPRYQSLPLPNGQDTDSAADYFVALWPVIDSYGRYLIAKEVGNTRLVEAGDGYFLTENAMREGNPQDILERGEKVELPPVQIIHGSADTNVPLHLVERFAENYTKAGGHIELEIFPDQPHTFAADPGPVTDDAIGRIKAFIAKQLST